MSIYKGGYITIDMLGLTIGDSDNKATIPGIYSKFLEANGKIVVYKNINLQGQEFDMLIPVGIVDDSDNNYFSVWLDPLGTVQLIIENSDTVYVQN